MAELHHFSYGWITPAFSYGFSVLGSLLALVCTARAREVEQPARRAGWLALAAWSLGGTGIWVMHFMAMIGFDVIGTPVRYEVVPTIASWAVAIVVVGVGLFIVGFGRRSALKLIGGGVLTGVGVAAMHYSGMAAMRVAGTVSYDRQLVLASVTIAVVAATVALWFAMTLRRAFAIGLAALIMGVAVNGMHFTGMAGLRVHLHDVAGGVTGVPALTFVGPIMVFVLLVVITLAYALLTSTGESDYVRPYPDMAAAPGAPVGWGRPAPPVAGPRRPTPVRVQRPRS
ncbi:MAG TPA: MHYT domain-containing protein [Jiangellales bacterium]|nr:MHYT domain-containing protein [Jiangellales bacterium]